MSNECEVLTLTQLLAQLNENAEQVSFEQVLQVIDDNYHYTPAAFKMAN
jgi:hypothetical protein